MNGRYIYAIIGRSLATAYGLFFGSMFIGTGISEPDWTEIPTLMVIIFILVIFSIIVTWFEIRLGAWLLLIFGLAFGLDSYFRSGNNQLFAALVTGLPLIISSFLLFIQVEKNNKKKGGMDL